MRTSMGNKTWLFALLFRFSKVSANDVVDTRIKKYAFQAPEGFIANLGPDECTSIIAGPKATAGGFSFTTHTADCLDCDFRWAKVPALDWPEGTMRPVHLYNEAYPRLVNNNRGLTWSKANLEDLPQKKEQEESKINGYIPEVSHTYAVIEANYGIMNEHQVAIGESTCSARLASTPIAAGGDALLEAGELTRIALERAKTAREAITVMGTLAEEYGFYGSVWDGTEIMFLEAGEALTVADPTEAWMFHILPDDTGKSAVWAAQRVPDDSVSVVANTFVIKEIDPADTDNFMVGKDTFNVAKRLGAYTDEMEERGEKLNFLQCFTVPRGHWPYSTRRMWRVFTKLAPQTWGSLSPFTSPFFDDYPFSVKPDSPISIGDVKSLMRDHYEGTPFDTTRGVFGGPFGDPDRNDMVPPPDGSVSAEDLLLGSWERTISIHRTSYSFIAPLYQHKPNELAMLYAGNYAPAESAYTPFYLLAQALPDAYVRGSLFRFDHSVAWWAFALVGNYAKRWYKYTRDDIALLQAQVEAETEKAMREVEEEVQAILAAKNDSDGEGEGGEGEGGDADTEIMEKITGLTIARGIATHAAFRDFFSVLVAKYHDGYRLIDPLAATIAYDRLFYPRWWLEAVGFFHLDNVLPVPYMGYEGATGFAPNAPVNEDGSVELMPPSTVEVFVTPPGDPQAAWVKSSDGDRVVWNKAGPADPYAEVEYVPYEPNTVETVANGRVHVSHGQEKEQGGGEGEEEEDDGAGSGPVAGWWPYVVANYLVEAVVALIVLVALVFFAVGFFAAKQVIRRTEGYMSVQNTNLEV